MEVYEEDYRGLEEALRRLRRDSNAKAVFLIDKNGQQIAAAGDIENFDSTSLASLTAPLHLSTLFGGPGRVSLNFRHPNLSSLAQPRWLTGS